MKPKPLNSDPTFNTLYNFQLNSEEGDDSLFDLVSELESLDQMDKRAPYNFGVGKRYVMKLKHFPIIVTERKYNIIYHSQF